MVNAKKDVKHANKYGIDALSQVLHLLNLDVHIYFNAQMSGNWCVPERTLEATCFHMVTSGSCMLDVPEHFHGLLEAGDLAIFPREIIHTLSNSGLEIKPSNSQLRDDPQQKPVSDSTGILCGEVHFHHKSGTYLLDALPQVFILRYDQTNDWPSPILKMLVSEKMKPGPASKAIFDKLAELLFTYAIRQYVLDNPGKVGMFAVYGHHRLVRAINSIHHNPGKNWTLEAMAKEAAFSRTTFAETFKAVSGWTARQYLIWWRMQLAWSLLSCGESVTCVAAKVGYKSESAFSRAFRNTFSLSAGKVRRDARATETVVPRAS